MESENGLGKRESKARVALKGFLAKKREFPLKVPNEVEVILVKCWSHIPFPPLESWFSSLPIHISLNTHPTPSPTTPLTVPFSFFPFFSLFFLSSHQSTHTLFTFHLLPHAPVCSTLGSKTWQEWQNLNRKSVVKKSIFQTRKNSLRKSILYTVCLKSSSYWRTLLTSECDVHYFVKLSNKWPAHLVFRTVYAVINSLIVSFSNVHKIKSFLQNCQCIISFINNFLQNRKI